MESVDSLQSGAPAFPGADANAAGTGGALEAEWHSISLEESLRSETEYCFLLSEGKKPTEPSTRKVDLSMCGLSKFIGGDGADDDSNGLGGHTTTSNVDCRYISIKASEDCSGVKEVRVSIRGLEDHKKCAENVAYETGGKVMNDSGSMLRPGDEGCFPLLQQVRAFIKGAKLSCAGLLSGDGKPFLTYGWSSLLQRSFFSVKSSEASSTESEAMCKKSSNSSAAGLNRTTSAPTPASSICISGSETLKAHPLQARDPASRAEALPLAHYRPTDGAIWKDGDANTAQSTTASKSPGHVNSKKPPKPPRHPGRATSLDSATIAAHRAAKKSRDRASAKRKSRAAAAAASTGLTPLVALVLTIGFGALMVFQGVFVQTNVSYGRNADGVFVDAHANSRSSMPTQNVVSAGGTADPIDPHLPASLQIDLSNSEAIFGGALQKSMSDLPWSRSSLASQVKSTPV